MPRVYADRFEPLDGTPIYTFWRMGTFEYEPSQPGRSPVFAGIGSHYGLRMRGTKDALKDIGIESVRGSYYGTPTEQDAAWIAARRLTGKYGKLWILMNDGTRRWANAECQGLPELSFDYRPQGLLALVFTFQRFTDWFAENAASQNQTITTNGQTWVVNNTGNLPATRMTMRIRASSTTAFTNPQIVNQTTNPDWFFGHNRTASTVNDEIRLDTRRAAVEWSTNDGASYVTDLANLAFPPSNAQKLLTFSLLPGNNTLQALSVTPNFSVDLEWDIAYA